MAGSNDSFLLSEKLSSLFYPTIVFESVVFMTIKSPQIGAHIRTSNDKIATRRLLALKNRLSETPGRIPVT